MIIVYVSGICAVWAYVDDVLAAASMPGMVTALNSGAPSSMVPRTRDIQAGPSSHTTRPCCFMLFSGMFTEGEFQVHILHEGGNPKHKLQNLVLSSHTMLGHAVEHVVFRDVHGRGFVVWSLVCSVGVRHDPIWKTWHFHISRARTCIIEWCNNGWGLAPLFGTTALFPKCEGPSLQRLLIPYFNPWFFSPWLSDLLMTGETIICLCTLHYLLAWHIIR